jgi:hypothetical protein
MSTLALDRKKRIEKLYVEEARRASLVFPGGDLVPHENPDFLLPTECGAYGIEVTELCRERPRTEAATLSRIPRKAKALYNSFAGTEPIDISLAFSRHATDLDPNQLMNSLVEFERLYLAAQCCLLNGTRPPLDFLGQTGWPSWASAEFAALLNTVERSPANLLGVDDNVWQRWSTLTLWYAFTGTDELARDFHAFLAQRLPSFIGAAEQVLNLYIPESRCYSIVDGLRFDWAPEIARFMLEQTRNIDLGNSCWDTFVALGLMEARQLFEEYLWEEFGRLRTRSDEGRDERLITIVALLLRHAKPGTWTAVRELIFAEPSIGQEAVGRAGDVSQENNWLGQMGDGEVAELYIWMNRQFPADIGQIQGATFFGGPVTIRMLRDSALVSMRSRGNLKVFRSVLQALPEVAWASATRHGIPAIARSQFAARASATIASALGLSPGASWAMCVSDELIRRRCAGMYPLLVKFARQPRELGLGT